MIRFFSRRPLRQLLAATCTLLLGACAGVNLKEPMPSILVPAPVAAGLHPLVIVLPGRYDSLHDLETAGIAQAIQHSWPVADVLLVGATPAYYQDGGLVRRLREQVIEPARRKGYREIWLSGASQGGMGSLFYEYAYPHEVAGLVLFAPYMGDPDLIRGIAAAGGPAQWQPPLPKPAAMNLGNYQVETWRVIHQWSIDPARTERVWLACGSRDDFLSAAKMIAARLPAGHFIEPPGGHKWQVWDQAATRIFSQIAAIDDGER